MKTGAKILVILLGTFICLCGTAGAYPMNIRPDVSLPLGTGLQDFFDSNGQTIDVIADQDPAAYFQTSTSQNSLFTIMLEAASWRGTNTFGLYNLGDTSNLFEVFSGANGVGYFAAVSFDVGGESGKVVVNSFDSSSMFIGSTVYTGINAGAFGFYLDARDRAPTAGVQDDNDGLYFTEDALNSGGMAQALIYAGTGASSGDWWIAFEDQDRNIASDSDFTDFVVEAQSITPIPEPATMLLLGTGLIGLAGLGRRRLRKK